jgi:hypothetical protein
MTALRNFSAQRFEKEDAPPPLKLFLSVGSQNADGDSLCWNRYENLSDNSCRTTSSSLLSTYKADQRAIVKSRKNPVNYSLEIHLFVGNLCQYFWFERLASNGLVNDYRTRCRRDHMSDPPE